MTDVQPLNTDLQYLDAKVQRFVIKTRKRRANYDREAAIKTPWQTNCAFKFQAFGLPTDAKLNIMTTRDLDALIEAWAWLVQIERGRNEAAQALGLPPVTEYCGYPFDAWRADLKNRARQLSLEAERKEIEQLEVQVRSLMSEAQRRAEGVEALAAAFGDDDDDEPVT